MKIQRTLNLLKNGPRTKCVVLKEPTLHQHLFQKHPQLKHQKLKQVQIQMIQRKVLVNQNPTLNPNIPTIKKIILQCLKKKLPQMLTMILLQKLIRKDSRGNTAITLSTKASVILKKDQGLNVALSTRLLPCATLESAAPEQNVCFHIHK